MISADVYGKKTMLSTSGVGLSKITEKLNDMQREWNSFQASLAETKARLEASLMKWSDVDSGISQLRCWMKEVTRRLLEVDHLSTLNEKKAQLQRTKVIHSDSDYKKLCWIDLNKYKCYIHFILRIYLVYLTRASMVNVQQPWNPVSGFVHGENTFAGNCATFEIT